MSERLITVITPFYNLFECMNKLIEFMLNQTYLKLSYHFYFQ